MNMENADFFPRQTFVSTKHPEIELLDYMVVLFLIFWGTSVMFFIVAIPILLLFSCSVVSDSLWSHGLQHVRLPCPLPSPGAGSNSCPSSQWCHPTSCPLSAPSPPAFHLSQHQGLFQWVSSSHQIDKVLELQLQHQSFQWLFRTDLI